VPGYGTGLAGDTGGGVRGKWVDLGYDDENLVAWPPVGGCVSARRSPARRLDTLGSAKLAAVQVVSFFFCQPPSRVV